MIPDFEAKEDAKKMFYKLKEWSLSEEHYEYGIYLNYSDTTSKKQNE